jgi:hypothetical protein
MPPPAARGPVRDQRDRMGRNLPGASPCGPLVTIRLADQDDVDVLRATAA